MSETQTLTRALDILFAISEAGTAIAVSEIASRAVIPESIAY